MAAKRHLNVIVEPTAAEHGPERSRAQWVMLGVLFVVATWPPLAMLGLWLSRAMNLGHSGGWLRQLWGILPVVGSFAVAAYLGGLVVIRFGSKKGDANALLTGGLSGALLGSVAAVGGGLQPWPVGVAAYITLISVGTVASMVGGRRGRRLGYAATLKSSNQPD